MRLIKFLSKTNISSRREAEKLIEFQYVKVNGKIATSLFQEIDPLKDKVTVRGQIAKIPSSYVYYILNKPAGYICSNRRMNNEKLAIDLISHHKGRLFTVGRLDKETSGLILITNDGEFADAVSHPSNQVHKEYLVKTVEEITADNLKILGDGAIVERTLVRPVSIKKVRSGTLKITLGEGKKHEVRELVKNAGLTLIDLVRIRIGSLHLGKMELGSFRSLSLKERSELALSKK
jgi:23S rRNA pseudouridine2605 synthase